MYIYPCFCMAEIKSGMKEPYPRRELSNVISVDTSMLFFFFFASFISFSLGGVHTHFLVFSS